MDVIEIHGDGSEFVGPTFTAYRTEDGSWYINRAGLIGPTAIRIEASEVAEFQMLAKLLGLAR